MKKGFTLIEILVVIVIIGILAVLIVPNIVESFNEANTSSMKIQENQVLDSAKLFLEDYCRHPISSDYKNTCNSVKKLMQRTAAGDLNYVCLSDIKANGYLEDEIYYSGSSVCKGFITTLVRVDNGTYTDTKVYLKCGEDYETEGINSQVSNSGAKVVNLCN